VTKRIKFQGLIVGDYYGDKELMHAFQTDMARYVQEGKVRVCWFQGPVAVVWTEAPSVCDCSMWLCGAVCLQPQLRSCWFC
jgi:hypothetical protein